MHKLDTIIQSEIGKVLKVEEFILHYLLFTKKGDERDVTSRKSFYENPKPMDFFCYEEGLINGKEAVLTERAIPLGIIKIFSEPLATLKLDKNFEKRFPEFNYQQHSEELYEYSQLKPHQGQIIVFREGIIIIEDEEPIKFAYKNLQTPREIYLEKPKIKDLKEYIQNL